MYVRLSGTNKNIRYVSTRKLNAMCPEGFDKRTPSRLRMIHSSHIDYGVYGLLHLGLVSSSRIV